MRCPNGHDVQTGQRFCPECGAPLEAATDPLAAAPPGPVASASSAGTAAAAAPAGPAASEAPAPPRRRRGRRLLVAVVAVAAVAAGALVVANVTGSSTDDEYLADLRDAGLLDEFRTERAAVIHAQEVCETFEGTGDPKGSKADAVAVAHYCAQFSDDFKQLRTTQIRGSFVVFDDDAYPRYGEGRPCEGEGGYGDINASTRVLVTTLDGDVLARTELGDGRTDGAYGCKFTFFFHATEGEDEYIVAVGDRGESSYTFSELTGRGVQLSLG